MSTEAAEGVKAYARAIGFDLVGITTADAFPEEEARLGSWVEAGLHGAMGYVAEHAPRAARPAEVVPGARSAVVVARAYRRDPEAPEDGRLRGRISAYAWGTDYHLVMEQPLAQLSAFLMARGARVARYYVDTGPLLDRALARRAGLGWIGKNSMLITKAGVGSYVFLGEVLTDLVLPPDAPVDGSCGRCRICLDQCPTGAIVAPYVVDARRCISYLTIELRGWIPRELRPLMGTWVFGCDVCQDVCPHNTPARHGEVDAFAPRRDVAFPDLVELLQIDERTYQERFRRSAVKRAKRQGLRRNAAVALGNLRDPRAVEPLARALNDEDPIIRGHAAWALGRINGTEAGTALTVRLAVEDDKDVLAELKGALGRLYQ